MKRFFSSHLKRNFNDVKLIMFFAMIILIYLLLTAILILAQVERSIDQLSLSRTYLTGERITRLLAQASNTWLSFDTIPDLNAKLEDTLLKDYEISAIVIQKTDGLILASTGSRSLISTITDEWRNSSLRHFALQGENHPFVTRSAGVEFCAMQVRNANNQIVAIVWLARRRETARRALEMAFHAISNKALVFGGPVILLTSLAWYLGISHRRRRNTIEIYEKLK